MLVVRVCQKMTAVDVYICNKYIQHRTRGVIIMIFFLLPNKKSKLNSFPDQKKEDYLAVEILALYLAKEAPIHF